MACSTANRHPKTLVDLMWFKRTKLMRKPLEPRVFTVRLFLLLFQKKYSKTSASWNFLRTLSIHIELLHLSIYPKQLTNYTSGTFFCVSSIQMCNFFITLHRTDVKTHDDGLGRSFTAFQMVIIAACLCLNFVASMQKHLPDTVLLMCFFSHTISSNSHLLVSAACLRCLNRRLKRNEDVQCLGFSYSLNM